MAQGNAQGNKEWLQQINVLNELIKEASTGNIVNQMFLFSLLLILCFS